MSASPTNTALPNTKPRYVQINLCSSILQETKDTQISRNPSKYLTKMKTMDIHQNKAHLAISSL